jgi:hypothetical protein
VSGYLEFNSSPAHIISIGQGIIADAKQFAAGVDPYRASVISPCCFGDDDLGDELRKAYPSQDDINGACDMQNDSVQIEENFGHSVGDVVRMVEEVVAQGKKNVDGTRAT